MLKTVITRRRWLHDMLKCAEVCSGCRGSRSYCYVAQHNPVMNMHASQQHGHTAQEHERG